MAYGKHKSIPAIVLGNGALNCLKEYQNEKIALVIDAFLENSPVMDALKAMWANRDMRVVACVNHEPSYEAIDPYIEEIRAFAPTLLVAIGGGSTMDTAKALWLFYELEDMSWERAIQGNLPAFPGKCQLIGVPTTSGTGSETTSAAVFKSYDGTKTMIIDDCIRPNSAILDYQLVQSVPCQVVAHSGVDALAHVLGAMSCISATHVDHMICTQVAVTIMKNLKASYEGDARAKEKMHVCAFLAGDAISNAGGGLEHKFDRFAKEYQLPHGLVIGILLPYTMRLLLDKGHYVDVAQQLGHTGNAKELQLHLIEDIWNLYEAIGIPRTLKEAGVPEEYMEHIPEYIRQVVAIGQHYLVDGYPGDNVLTSVYKEAYYGIK